MEPNMKSVKVDVKKGMFSSEFVVTIKTIKGNISFFVGKDKIENRGGDHFLRVYLVGKNVEKNTETLALPFHVEGAQDRIFDVDC